jgi:hypothetical protein
MIHLFLARLGIDREQLVHQFYRPDRPCVLLVELDRIYKVSPCVAPAAGVHHSGRAQAAFVSDVIIRLQNAREGAKKLLPSFAPAAHAEIEHRAATRRAVLPQKSAMILATLVVRLHIDRSFVGLDIT